jgi:hypothetical protein
MEWMPYSDKNNGRVVATGFSNGIVRILLLENSGFTILTAFKAHDDEVLKITYSPDLKVF